MPWNWGRVSCNPNITIEIIKDNLIDISNILLA